MNLIHQSEYDPNLEQYKILFTFPMDIGLNSMVIIRNSIFFTSLDSFDLFEYSMKGEKFYKIKSKSDFQNFQLLNFNNLILLMEQKRNRKLNFFEFNPFYQFFIDAPKYSLNAIEKKFFDVFFIFSN